jgi:AcrR family transcriptional regulator
MRTRSAAVEQTRQRIVMAAIRLFSEQTATATSMEDVAAAAGVSPATVYRHFGDFDGLADACAQTAFFIAEIPTPQEAVQQFADQPDLRGKLDRFIAISCHCYERAAEWLAAERRERHLPAFARTLAREEAALDAIVRGLLEPAGAPQGTVAVVKTLVDFPFWESLVAAGVAPGAIPAVMDQLVLDQLGHAGVPTGTETVGGTHGPSRTRRPRPSPRSR